MKWIPRNWRWPIAETPPTPFDWRDDTPLFIPDPFVTDTQLLKALAPWLRDRGCQAEHILEIGLAQSKDAILWRYAQEHQAALMTKDEDFAEWVRRGRPGPPETRGQG